MVLSRRKFIQLVSAATAAGLIPELAQAASSALPKLYNAPMQGNVRLLHFTDAHGQIEPVYFREPNVNLGVGDAYGRAPHVVGRIFLKRWV